MNSELWNQTNHVQPATSAHQMLLSSKEIRDKMEKFVAFINNQNKNLTEAICSMESEATILKQFLYKLSAVFRQDKSIKILKLVRKSVAKFLDINLASIVNHMIEQHSFSHHLGNMMFVSPKPKYEFALLRFQGAVRLLAQILCYCQHATKLTLPRMHLGHFVNISVISTALVARIWATSLHVLKSLTNFYSETKKIYSSSSLPDSSVHFLPMDYILPDNLQDWLKSDKSLSEIHHLISLNVKIERKEEPKAEIWKSIRVDDDDEMSDLMELRELVSKSMVETTNDSQGIKRKLEDDIQSTATIVPSTDIGELVSRNDTIHSKNKKQKKRKRKKREQGM